MLLELSDFDIDMFLRFDDKNIYIYYSDFETIPELAEIIPLGSFDDEDKFPFADLNFMDRIRVGLLFMERDLFAVFDPEVNTTYIWLNRIYEEFINIPEIIEFCKPYFDLCSNPEGDTPEWCTDCNNTLEFDCPSYCEDTCSVRIPVDVFYNNEYTPDDPENYYADLYYLIIVYFNGIYRTTPEYSENYGVYDILTDVDFERNKYSLIINIKEFFTKEFIYFLKTPPGSLPFGNDYGTEIKYAIQTKNTEIKQTEVENEINFFILNFNKVYGDLVNVEYVNIVSQESDVGGDGWLVEVFATVAKERLTYRLIL